MIKLLAPVDGSENSNKAVRFLIGKISQYKEPPEIHLLNVQYPIASGNVKQFIRHEEIDRYYHDEGMAALQAARKLLGQAGIPYVYHVGVGEPAETIVRYAQEHDCRQIVMSPRGLGSVMGMLLGSVAAKVLHLSEVPVLLVKGDA
ncbi:MAG: universal stress protein [Betaproteobacteria bacterium]|nr:universal stress protein [Betaproteobacteria bacterium]